MGENLKRQQCAWAVAWQDHGDRLAFDRLIDSVSGLARFISRKYAVHPSMSDDLMSEALCGAVEAAEGFDRSIPDGYAGLAGLHMHGRCRDFTRRYMSPVTSSCKIGPKGHAVPLISDCDKGVDLAVDEPDEGPNAAVLARLIDDAGLDARERDIVFRFLHNEPIAVLEQRFHISRTRVGQIQTEAFGKIRAAAERQGLELSDLL